ncbi:accessory factor associated with RNA polymerase II [Pichia californica]|uniref:Accessory factor associated with RNA polymerase II n=1 Tax=Pichia californica TaxID=460514 RepID=A0A9P6WHU4_9ASCO|nr:accessory factor associated with RNA polymerase II [[Candida] californica]
MANQDIKLDNTEFSNSTNITINKTFNFKFDENSGFKNSKGKEEYNVKSVYFCWINKDDNTTDYIEKCNNFNINIISFLERNDLNSFIKGDITTCDNLVDSSEGLIINDDSNEKGKSESINDLKNVKEKPIPASSSSSSSAAAAAASKSTTKPIDSKGKNNSQSNYQSSSSSTTQVKEKKHVLSESEKIDYKESKRRKLESDPLLKCISIHEIELIDHDKALRGTQKSNDFSNLIRECEYKIVRPLKSTTKVVKSTSTTNSSTKIPSKSGLSKVSTKLPHSSSSSSSSLLTSSSILNDSSQSLATILHKRDPIIILSPSAISMLTMNNVKSFLENGKFIDVHNKEVSENTNTNTNTTTTNSNSNMIQIVRQSKKFNRKIKFVVVNNVEKFFIKPEYWDRVVAVFTTGQEWQFKNYKINKPNLLFQKVKGFYINYNGDSIPLNIKNWNVQIISLDRNQRFKDRQISELLWESIERFMASKGFK